MDLCSGWNMVRRPRQYATQTPHLYLEYENDCRHCTIPSKTTTSNFSLKDFVKCHDVENKPNSNINRKNAKKETNGKEKIKNEEKNEEEKKEKMDKHEENEKWEKDDKDDLPELLPVIVAPNPAEPQPPQSTIEMLVSMSKAATTSLVAAAAADNESTFSTPSIDTFGGLTQSGGDMETGFALDWVVHVAAWVETGWLWAFGDGSSDGSSDGSDNMSNTFEDSSKPIGNGDYPKVVEKDGKRNFVSDREEIV